MRCEILLFAQLREAIGVETLEIELPDDATVADAIAHLAAEHAAVADLGAHVAVAMDERYVARNAPLANGCRLALIPPVSGG
jgi:molybdopterin converting factor subunit 1